jgi:hypothetical protein
MQEGILHAAWSGAEMLVGMGLNPMLKSAYTSYCSSVPEAV